MIDDIIKVFIL